MRSFFKNGSMWGKQIIASCLMITLTGILFPAVTVSGEESSFKAVEAKLASINEQEKAVLVSLFTQTQKIEAAEMEAKEIEIERQNLENAMKSLQRGIDEREIEYAAEKESMKKVLQSYQRMGPGSSLEILLESTNLSDFLHRVGIVRELSRSTGELLTRLQNNHEKLLTEKALFAEKKSRLEDRQQKIGSALSEAKRLKREQEDMLASLAQQKGNYQSTFSDMKHQWDVLKPLILSTTKEFSRIIKNGGLPMDALQITFSLTNVKGALSDRNLDRILAEYPTLPPMTFEFHKGLAVLKMPAQNLVLEGLFEIQEGNILEFCARSGSFYGMPLEASAMKELFSEGSLEINLQPLLTDYTLSAVEIGEGVVELSVGL